VECCGRGLLFSSSMQIGKEWRRVGVGSSSGGSRWSVAKVRRRRGGP
jgi:hypothetical protein